MPANLVVRNSILALDSRPIVHAAASRALLDDANGTVCCCGGIGCNSCCRAGNTLNQCCYRIGQLIDPQVVHYYCRWFAQDPEIQRRTAEAEFILSGGPFDISNTSGVCEVTITASGTWRSWLDGNQVRTFTDAAFALSLGPLLTGEWGVSFPTHPNSQADLWSPRNQSVSGTHGCDFTDMDGFASMVFPGYFNTVEVTAVYEVLIAEAGGEDCLMTSGVCECVP